MSLRNFSAMALCFLLLACGDRQARPELISKLRAIGVAAQPASVVPSTDEAPQTVKLTAHLLLPAGQSIDSVAAFVDDGSRFSFGIPDLLVDTASATYTEYGPVRHYQVSASFVAPKQEVLTAAGGVLARLSYGIEVTAGEEIERIVGSVNLVPAGSEALAWPAVGVEIVKPTGADAAAVGDGAELQMETTASAEDSVKSGWYVTSGKISNRRARSAEWTEPAAGEQVVIATARCKTCRNFALQIRAVTVQ